MKTMNRILICFAMSILFLNNTALADNGNPTLKAEGNQLYVSLENVSVQTYLKIVDTKGFTWIEEKVTTSGEFKKVFNLEKLPVGSYNIIIKSNDREIVQPITLSNAAMILDESKRAEYFEPNLSKKRTNMQLSLENPTNSEISVTVINMKGIKVFHDMVKGQKIVDKKYNLRFLTSGLYAVFVDNGHEVYTQTISL